VRIRGRQKRKPCQPERFSTSPVHITWLSSISKWPFSLESGEMHRVEELYPYKIGCEDFFKGELRADNENFAMFWL
jgi:hypothetical protein